MLAYGGAYIYFYLYIVLRFNVRCDVEKFMAEGNIGNAEVSGGKSRYTSCQKLSGGVKMHRQLHERGR